MIIWEAKDPDEVVDYAIDFSLRLGCDSISAVAFTLTTAAGTTVDSSDYTGSVAIARISGGTLGQVAKVLCEILTLGGQVMQEQAKLPIRSR